MGIDGEYLWGISDLSGGGPGWMHGISVEVLTKACYDRSLLYLCTLSEMFNEGLVDYAQFACAQDAMLNRGG